MPKRKATFQRRIDRLTREKYALLRTIEQLLRELKKKGRQPSTLAAREGNLEMTSYPTIPALSVEPSDRLPVPEQEIMRVLQFLGFQMIAGQVDVELFDQVTNTLIRICAGDFPLELVEEKRKWKAIFAQCQGDR